MFPVVHFISFRFVGCVAEERTHAKKDARHWAMCTTPHRRRRPDTEQTAVEKVIGNNGNMDITYTYTKNAWAQCHVNQITWKTTPQFG